MEVEYPLRNSWNDKRNLTSFPFCDTIFSFFSEFVIPGIYQNEINSFEGWIELDNALLNYTRRNVSFICFHFFMTIFFLFFQDDMADEMEIIVKMVEFSLLEKFPLRYVLNRKEERRIEESYETEKKFYLNNFNRNCQVFLPSLLDYYMEQSSKESMSIQIAFFHEDSDLISRIFFLINLIILSTLIFSFDFISKINTNIFSSVLL